MTGWTIAMLLCGAFAGGFINGLAGFGTALFALGFFLNVMPPVQAVAIVVILSVTSGLQGLWRVRHDIHSQPARVLRFLIPGLLGVPLGVALLSMIDAQMLKLVIAGFLILYGGYFSFRKTLPVYADQTRKTDATVGFLGGILGGAASLSGALPTMWCSVKPWPKTETRAVLQSFNVAILGVTALLLAWRGAYGRDTLLMILVALPSTMIAAQIGLHVFGRLSTELFRRFLIGLTFVSGTILMLRELWAFGAG
ncbi:sulfite exporter TauE/SafE family protein [Roseovarius sp. C7]|uniref:sulfite exporter TauE/SafE family protein n=1 Tax=Roseovarius sp. C7 TaxID=3398643 RepID=UPI0039F45C57